MMNWIDFGIGSGLDAIVTLLSCCVDGLLTGTKIIFPCLHRRAVCEYGIHQSSSHCLLPFSHYADNRNTGSRCGTNVRPKFTTAAIASSGFSAERTGLWHKQCGTARTHIDDPYLRCMFSFLAHEEDGFETVTNETEISLYDRMAFACNFLSDLKLPNTLKRL
ncbi:GATOR complex protein MIOS-like [Uranotaenia lowii]|uniref:GATOR complex protein MIOS-like n=1 Tax=Uranotaenia lowii TaxID=190385 RepID=UPI002478520D|nr:GATOR complex protein MIOS-like [Uranotaenia lowii]